jgi:hypothetical protein
MEDGDNNAITFDRIPVASLIPHPGHERGLTQACEWHLDFPDIHLLSQPFGIPQYPNA